MAEEGLEGLLELPLSSPEVLAFFPERRTAHEGKDGMGRAPCLVSYSVGPSMVLEGKQCTAFLQGGIPRCFWATFQASAIGMLGRVSHSRSLGREKGREEGEKS